ncbi:hypothetical protein [Shewanella xiamenensis]|uniref:hypothetical protein n=1 Tax=Shewanella xiamenensis TaxID=332186 RepID=UPI0021BFD86C|nr:hypothetical protein [Shewanella xiamenensis]MCT8868744.1 hypothetical protein [Shewanella xiamenensis]
MDIKQTNLQSILDRLYKTALTLLLPQLGLLTIVGSKSDQYTFLLMFIVFLAVNILIPLWLLLFNTGKSKIDSFSITIDDQNILVSTYDEVQKIDKASYCGYKVTSHYPKQIQLLEANGEHIEFSYYALNKEQRNRLFDYLGPAKS